MNNASVFGAHLKALRQSKNLTQEELADQVGRSVDAISKIERGASLPSLDTIIRLSTSLETTLTDLIAPLESNAQKSDQRVRLEAELFAMASSLTDAQLKIAVRQIEALGVSSE